MKDLLAPSESSRNIGSLTKEGRREMDLQVNRQARRYEVLRHMHKTGALIILHPHRKDPEDWRQINRRRDSLDDFADYMFSEIREISNGLTVHDWETRIKAFILRAEKAAEREKKRK